MIDMANTFVDKWNPPVAVRSKVLQEAAACFTAARGAFVMGARYLHQISSQRLWEGQFDSFGSYVESECQISQSFAAKLIKVYEHYVLKGGFPETEIRRIDQEKLYMAIALPGNVQNQLVRAETWTRGEIRAELVSKGGPDCKHNYPQITICSHCHQRV